MAARKGRLRLLAAGAALATAWVAAPHGVPLYDGLGIPDEPYRYVSPPPGYQQTPPPSSISLELPAVAGTNDRALLAQTKEQTSQSGLFITPKALSAPAGTTTFTITITPEAPDKATAPGAVDGNVYRVDLLADGKPTVTLSDAGKDVIPYGQRATTPKIAAATLYYRPAGGSWRTIPDDKGTTTDRFTGYFAGAGEYALVPDSGAASGSSSHLLVIVILVLVVLAMAGAVVLIRLSRRTPTRS